MYIGRGIYVHKFKNESDVCRPHVAVKGKTPATSCEWNDRLMAVSKVSINQKKKKKRERERIMNREI